MLYGVFVVGFFSVWLFISACYQAEIKWCMRLKTRDRFSLIPRWTFFAPNPISSDYHVIYRDRMEDGTLGPWKTSEALASRNALLAALWNPRKRSRKALTDWMRNLKRVVRRSRGRENVVRMSFPYIALLYFVSHLEHDESSCSTQFAVVQTFGHHASRASRLILHSEFHELH